MSPFSASTCHLLSYTPLRLVYLHSCPLSCLSDQDLSRCTVVLFATPGARPPLLADVPTSLTLSN